ncbi:Hypothetical protein POVN_LOCUS707 [uncultured virus]|nr:Hypothetical protein POVN_LOCUS707 [uncultured virus]
MGCGASSIAPAETSPKLVVEVNSPDVKEAHVPGYHGVFFIGSLIYHCQDPSRLYHIAWLDHKERKVQVVDYNTQPRILRLIGFDQLQSYKPLAPNQLQIMLSYTVPRKFKQRCMFHWKETWYEAAIWEVKPYMMQLTLWSGHTGFAETWLPTNTSLIAPCGPSSDLDDALMPTRRHADYVAPGGVVERLTTPDVYYRREAFEGIFMKEAKERLDSWYAGAKRAQEEKAARAQEEKARAVEAAVSAAALDAVLLASEQAQIEEDNKRIAAVMAASRLPDSPRLVPRHLPATPSSTPQAEWTPLAVSSSEVQRRAAGYEAPSTLSARLLRKRIESDRSAMMQALNGPRITVTPPVETKVVVQTKMPECAICKDAEVQCSFACGHGACNTCSAQLRTCHICRGPVTGQRPLFIT